MMTDQILWFAARGAGIVSLLLATGVMSLGILTAGRWQRPSWPMFLTAGLHRSLALLSVVFLGVHIVAAILDPFASLGVLVALVPLASPYRPLWIGLGVVSMYLTVALIVSSLLRSRIGVRTWRAIHWTAYAAWPLALAHGLGSGSDAFAPWFLAIEAACIAAVGVSLAYRLTSRRSVRRNPVRA